MHLFSYAGSANGYKVDLLFALSGKPYRRTEVSIFAGESRTPEFLAKNPAGRVPVLECDDGSFLPESNAILVHVARGTPFWPSETAAQDRVLAWLMFEQSEIEPVIGSARFWKLTGRDRDRADEFARRMTWARSTLDILEHQLARPALVGDQITIADLAVYAYSHLAGDLDLELGPSFRRWCERIETLPGYVAGPGPYDPLSRQ
jgi:glutathione S-transferase